MAGEMAIEDVYDLFETAFKDGDLSFFDRLGNEELYEHNAFLHQIANKRWDAAIILPKVQACPHWAWVIKNQFTIWQNQATHLEDAHYLFSHCPEAQRRQVVTRVYRYYSSAGMRNPEDVTAFVEAHREYLDHSLGNLGDVSCSLRVTRNADGSFVLDIAPRLPNESH